jgi:hypothetical protein
LDEFSFKECVFFSFLNNKCIKIKNLRKKKTTTISKRRRFCRLGHCIIFFILFYLVMFHEPQTWGHMVVEKLYVIYCMYIDFFQSSSSNCWIKINFDSKWTLSSKMLSCNFFKKNLVFLIAKEYHQNFDLLHIIILVIHHLFGEKWLTLSVLSRIYI